MMKRFFALFMIFFLLPISSVCEGVAALEFVELYSTRMAECVETYQSELGTTEFNPGLGLYTSAFIGDHIAADCSAGLLELQPTDLHITGCTFTAMDLNASDEKNFYYLLSAACTISALEYDYAAASAYSLGNKIGLYEYNNVVDLYIDICTDEIWEFISRNATEIVNSNEKIFCYGGENYNYYTQYYSATYNDTTVDYIYIVAEQK